MALNTHIPLHTTDQKRCFYVPAIGVMKCTVLLKTLGDSGLVLCTPIPLHTLCFLYSCTQCDPTMDVKRGCLDKFSGMLGTYSNQHDGQLDEHGVKDLCENVRQCSSSASTSHTLAAHSREHLLDQHDLVWREPESQMGSLEAPSISKVPHGALEVCITLMLCQL